MPKSSRTRVDRVKAGSLPNHGKPISSRVNATSASHCESFSKQALRFNPCVITVHRSMREQYEVDKAGHGKAHCILKSIRADILLFKLTISIIFADRNIVVTTKVLHSGQFRAESCVTDSNGDVDFFVGRLYDAHTGEVLARVDFDSVDGGMPWFMPDDSAVDFEGAQIGKTGGLSIPPSMIDRLRAKIP